MNLQLKGYVITTDSRQFIISKRQIVKEETKTEKVGDIRLVPFRYYSSFESTITALSDIIILKNDDITAIKSQLEEIKELLKSLGGEYNV